jgi:predicted nucleotidyltransferase
MSSQTAVNLLGRGAPGAGFLYDAYCAETHHHWYERFWKSPYRLLAVACSDPWVLKMRLNEEQVDQIRRSVLHHAGAQAKVYLFGSRLDDEKKGGDVDLLIESNQAISLIQQAKIKLELEHSLFLSVDVISYGLADDMVPFHRIARAQAVSLGG